MVMLVTWIITQILRDSILFLIDREILLGDRDVNSNISNSHPLLIIHQKSFTYDILDPLGLNEVKRMNSRGAIPVIFFILSHEFMRKLNTFPETCGFFSQNFLMIMCFFHIMLASLPGKIVYSCGDIQLKFHCCFYGSWKYIPLNHGILGLVPFQY